MRVQSRLASQLRIAIALTYIIATPPEHAYRSISGSSPRRRDYFYPASSCACCRGYPRRAEGPTVPCRPHHWPASGLINVVTEQDEDWHLRIGCKVAACRWAFSRLDRDYAGNALRIDCRCLEWINARLRMADQYRVVQLYRELRKRRHAWIRRRQRCAPVGDHLLPKRSLRFNRKLLSWEGLRILGAKPEDGPC